MKSANKMQEGTLGLFLKKWRNNVNLSQREVGRRLGVSASIVSLIERHRRRPSFSLISKIADLTTIEKRRALMLAWPEARSILITAAANPAANPWRRFAGNRAVLVRHHITASEMMVLKQVNQLGTVANPRYFLFVLNSIRQAMVEE